MSRVDDWRKTQVAELLSWLIDDSTKRQEKVERETARYPQMRKEMGLHLIDLSTKYVLEIGGGPIGIIADLHCGKKVILDPLTERYRQYWPCPYHIAGAGEELPQCDGEVDVVVISNALDHCQDPEAVIQEMERVLRPGGWLAIHNVINLASSQPHTAHMHNLDQFWFHNQINSDFETVHEVITRYGWTKGPNGRVGVKAFAGLYRKVTGYSK